jgi:hypothetical protein
VKSLSNKNREFSEILKMLIRAAYLADFLAFEGVFVIFRNLRLQKHSKDFYRPFDVFGESEDGKHRGFTF